MSAAWEQPGRTDSAAYAAKRARETLRQAIDYLPTPTHNDERYNAGVRDCEYALRKLLKKLV